jgi:D-alanyl-D-alanine carboxypeptidase (penicillin-binding protein 5/6)
MPQLFPRIIAVCCLLSGWMAASAATLPFTVEAASYLVQVDGKILWERDVERKLPPASLTKIMTVLLVMEHYRPLEIVTVGNAAAHETGTRLGLKAGDRLQVRDLLAASLLISANDACHALADHLAGNEKHFVQLMNRRAGEWGLQATHFANACGHDDERHYSTAHDLALLAGKALRYGVFTELVAKVAMNIQTADGRRSFALENKNALIGRYAGATGVKTGYTPKAGKCLIALAERGGVKVLLVLLNAPNRWWDAVDILDGAFAQANLRHAS